MLSRPIVSARALLLAAASSLAVIGPASAQTLDAALTDLLAGHPQLAAGAASVAAAAAGIDAARAEFFPTLTVTGAVGPERHAAVGADGYSSDVQQRLGVAVSQPLFDGFRRSAVLGAAKLDRAAAEATLEDTREVLLQQGITAYVNLVRAARQAELVRASEANLERQLGMAEEQVRGGRAIALDVLGVRVRLQQAKEQRIVAERSLGEAFAVYEQLFGVRPDPASLTMPALPAAMPISLDAAVDAAVTAGPRVAAAALRVEQAEAQTRAARSAYFPTVDLVGTANVNRDVAGSDGTERSLALLVQGQWRLNTGMAERARVAAATQQMAANAALLDDARRTARQAVQAAWELFASAESRLVLAAEALAIAEDIAEARRKRAAAGEDDAVLVLAAESDVVLAQVARLAAEADRVIAAYSLLYVTGQLTPETLGAAVP